MLNGVPSGGRGGGIKALPGGNGYSAQNVSVKLMFALMYKVPMRQISGGPEWMNADRYDVEARVDGTYSLDDLHLMYQHLLADRFNLKFHIETKDGNVYALMLDTPGSKMKINTGPQDFKIPVTFGPEGAIGTRVPMPYLCWFLGQQLQNTNRPVIDLTGLDKNYDFTLSYLPELPPDVSKDNPSGRSPRSTVPVRRREAAAWPETRSAKGADRLLRHRPHRQALGQLASLNQTESRSAD